MFCFIANLCTLNWNHNLRNLMHCDVTWNFQANLINWWWFTIIFYMKWWLDGVMIYELCIFLLFISVLVSFIWNNTKNANFHDIFMWKEKTQRKKLFNVSKITFRYNFSFKYIWRNYKWIILIFCFILNGIWWFFCVNIFFFQSAN